jgi:hypothetical protein
MNPKLLCLLSLCVVAGFPAARAEVSGSVSVEICIGKALPPPPSAVVIVDAPERHGPPPWAPSHWLSPKRAYYYYPDCYVYCRPPDRIWFYRDGNEWRAGAGLPGRIDFDLRHSVALTMETDRPYIYHEKVVTYYAPDYFQRVKIKEDHDKATDHDKGDGPGSDNGKGNGKKK